MWSLVCVTGISQTDDERTACEARMSASTIKSVLKAYFSIKPAKKILRLLGGKIKFELALQPSTASTAKIQIQFSRQGV